MWELLRAKAKADGAAPFFGIRYRQLRSYLAAMEHRQLHKRATKVKTTRSFVLPVAPVRLMSSASSIRAPSGRTPRSFIEGRRGCSVTVVKPVDFKSTGAARERNGSEPRDRRCLFGRYGGSLLLFRLSNTITSYGDRYPEGRTEEANSRSMNCLWPTV